MRRPRGARSLELCRVGPGDGGLAHAHTRGPGRGAQKGGRGRDAPVEGTDRGPTGRPVPPLRLPVGRRVARPPIGSLGACSSRRHGTHGGRTARVTSIRTGWDACRCWAPTATSSSAGRWPDSWTLKPGSIGRSAVDRGGRVDGPDRARRHRGPDPPVPAAAAAGRASRRGPRRDGDQRTWSVGARDRGGGDPLPPVDLGDPRVGPGSGSAGVPPSCVAILRRERFDLPSTRTTRSPARWGGSRRACCGHRPS